jgi:hypothetical protein
MQATLNTPGSSTNGHAEQTKRDLIIGKAFCRRAASAVRQRLKALNSNDDKNVLAVADVVLGSNG